MQNQEGKYNIKAVSNMLGIQAGTLRAWERRYQIIAPVRNDSGHRLYTEEHIKILKWLIEKVDKGFTISQAVSLLEKNELSITDTVKETIDDKSVVLFDELLDALLSFDEARAHVIMDKVFTIYSVEKVLIDILGTLLVRVGSLWEEGTITSAHEHFASSFLRSRIGSILHTLPTNGFLPKTVSVCGPGEWHELGLLIYTLYVKRKGFDTIYLGVSLADNDIHVVIEEINPKFLFLSCTLKDNLEKTLLLVVELESKYPNLHVGIGGHAIGYMNEEERAKFDKNIIGLNIEQWDHWLKQKMNE
ncbi:MerR family transcriptional regulator [Bacillus sp. FJAT-45066]|uniref:MerR family transcriptional regulator n=1 Tax=Bacillus sp. FJAT-45066 TaxID=2011010 RepID=UPI000BB882ED|nr:MerR family transcriptional regulator [Bacillus sp. FJAT-45066]